MMFLFLGKMKMNNAEITFREKKSKKLYGINFILSIYMQNSANYNSTVSQCLFSNVFQARIYKQIYEHKQKYLGIISSNSVNLFFFNVFLVILMFFTEVLFPDCQLVAEKSLPLNPLFQGIGNIGDKIPAGRYEF